MAHLTESELEAGNRDRVSLHELSLAAAADHEDATVVALESLEKLDEPVKGFDGLAEQDVAEETAQAESKVLTGKRLAIAFTGLLSATFLMAVDATIVSPALAKISSTFNASEQIGWIVAAYFLTEAACILAYGQLLQLYDRRLIFLIAIGLFELGSLLCGVAPKITVLILGRAVQGAGGAGIMVSNISIIAECTRLQDRPKLFGLFGAVFGLSSVIGPLLGGIFTDHVTWRLCFLINLPIGLIAVLAIIFLVPRSPKKPISPEMQAHAESRLRYLVPNPKWRKPFLVRLFCLDYFANFLFLAFVVLLVLALQWGGVKYPWTSGAILGPLVASVVLFGLFIGWEFYTADTYPLIAIKFFNNRSMVSASIIAFGCSFILQSGANYLPLFFQTTKHRTATESGVDLLSFCIGITGCAVFSGFVVSKTGNYGIWLMTAPILSGVGGGLLYTCGVDTPLIRTKGFAFLYAAGVGFIFQQSQVIVQANIPGPLIPSSTAIVSVFQLFGGLIGSTACSAVFQGTLVTALAKHAPSVDVKTLQSNIESLWDTNVVPMAVRLDVMQAYAQALRQIFLMGIAMSGILLFGGVLAKKVNLKAKDKARKVPS